MNKFDHNNMLLVHKFEYKTSSYLIDMPRASEVCSQSWRIWSEFFKLGHNVKFQNVSLKFDSGLYRYMSLD